MFDAGRRLLSTLHAGKGATNLPRRSVVAGCLCGSWWALCSSGLPVGPVTVGRVVSSSRRVVVLSRRRRRDRRLTFKSTVCLSLGQDTTAPCGAVRCPDSACGPLVRPQVEGRRNFPVDKVSTKY